MESLYSEWGQVDHHTPPHSWSHPLTHDHSNRSMERCSHFVSWKKFKPNAQDISKKQTLFRWHKNWKFQKPAITTPIFITIWRPSFLLCTTILSDKLTPTHPINLHSTTGRLSSMLYHTTGNHQWTYKTSNENYRASEHKSYEPHLASV